MADDDLDLLDDVDALIRDMEQSAPKEDFDPTKPRCENCDFNLEENDDGDFICPNCQAHATNIQQLEDTEMFLGGNDLDVGARAKISRKKTCGEDYGFAWSTDQAIFEVLLGQLKALKGAKLIDDTFCKAALNMWKCFWLKFIGPVIKDNYGPDELIPWEKARYLKQRDIQVLVQKDDNFFVPNFVSSQKYSRVTYPSRSTRFLNPDRKFEKPKRRPPGPIKKNVIEEDEEDTIVDQMEIDEELVTSIDDLIKESKKKKQLNKNEMTTILTLDRTLAFIEATARLLESPKPIFASDIVRWCNYRILPYFGAQNLLPEGINLNSLDMLMFTKRRTPKPDKVSIFACRLLKCIYHESMPFSLARPNFSQLLECFVRDLNLPYEFFQKIDKIVRPQDFYQIRDAIKSTLWGHIRQYNRLIYCILICHIKQFFNLDYLGIKRQHKLAQDKTRETSKRHFSFYDWIRQLCLRLKLVLKYDPYVLYHPITNVQNLSLTPALTNYIESLIEDRPIVDIHLNQSMSEDFRKIREEMADFLHNEIPRPDKMPERSTINNVYSDEPRVYQKHLKVRDFIHPFKDAFSRIRQFCDTKDTSLNTLLDNDFSTDNLVLDDYQTDFSIYDDQPSLTLQHAQIKFHDKWPGSFRIIIELGAYLFCCTPDDMMADLCTANDQIFPHTLLQKRQIRAAKRLKKSESNNAATPSPTIMEDSL